MKSNFKDMYPWEYDELPSYSLGEPQVKGYVEGYAKALSDLMFKLTGDSPCGKSYDPMKVSDGFLLSYAFDMKDGGRRHPWSDYKDVGEIRTTLLEETLEWIKDET